jgi:hypothetical protein
MSTRCTIGHNDDFHLYEECFDTSNVYLQLDTKFEAALAVGGPDWRDNAAPDRSSLTVKLDIKTWRAIAEAWAKSEWAAKPDRDYSKFSAELPAWIEELAKKSAPDGGQESP